MTKIYLVMARHGSYNFEREDIERIFFDKNVAKDYMDKKNKLLNIQKGVEREKEKNIRMMKDEDIEYTMLPNRGILYDQSEFIIKEFEVE